MIRTFLRRLKIAAITIAVPVVILLVYLGWLAYSGNFATVVAGEVYRSAQPTEAELAKYVSDHGIKTVLNLRGQQKPSSEWYSEEIAASQKLGLVHIDYRMSASRRLTQGQVLELAEIMRTAQKPLLIHCMSGSDRTGLASAIYRLLVAGTTEDEAGSQLSIRYGHFSVPYLSAAWPMDETWSDIRRWFGSTAFGSQKERPAFSIAAKL